MGVVNSMATTVGAGFTPASALGTNNNFLVDNVTVTNCFAQGIRVEGNATFRPAGPSSRTALLALHTSDSLYPTSDMHHSPVAPRASMSRTLTASRSAAIRYATWASLQPTTANATKGIWLNLCYGTTNEVNNNRVYGIRNFAPTVLNIARGIEVVLPTTGTVTAFVWNNTITRTSQAITAARSRPAVVSRDLL